VPARSGVSGSVITRELSESQRAQSHELASPPVKIQCIASSADDILFSPSNMLVYCSCVLVSSLSMSLVACVSGSLGKWKTITALCAVAFKV